MNHSCLNLWGRQGMNHWLETLWRDGYMQRLFANILSDVANVDARLGRWQIHSGYTEVRELNMWNGCGMDLIGKMFLPKFFSTSSIVFKPFGLLENKKIPSPLTHLPICCDTGSVSTTPSQSPGAPENFHERMACCPWPSCVTLPECSGWQWYITYSRHLELGTLLCGTGHFSYYDRNLICASEEWLQGCWA